jgi:iron complex outermembrane receptor protein
MGNQFWSHVRGLEEQSAASDFADLKQATRGRLGGFGLCMSLAALCSVGTPAYAEEATSKSGQDEGKLEEIVVTGTLIRGVAPTGAEMISVTPEDIKATGASTTDQLLASVPQIGNFFNNPPQIATGTNGGLQINRPNLRDLPGVNTASGAATLVLMDGHRIVGAGVMQNAPDPDVIPTSVIERVEIVPDGGSATYGADAVGGVINFVTKRHVNGVEVAARYGYAKDYNTTDGHLTFGHDWGSGSAYVSYNFSYHDALHGSDRSYVKNIDWSTGIPANRTCDTPNVTIGTTHYALPGLVPGTFNACDLSRLATIYPREERSSVFVGASQDFAGIFHFDLRAFFTNRLDTSNGGPATGNPNITPTNPYYNNFTGTGATQNVQFSYGPVFGNSLQRQDTNLNEWGITPTLAIDLGSKWQLRTMLNYGRSNTSFTNAGVNATLQTQYAAGTTVATALNPYAIASTNPQLLDNLVNYQISGNGISELANARVIADGSLFTLPGGDLSVALGAEYIKDSFKSRSSGAAGTEWGQEGTVPYSSYGRDVKSGFGELQIPIVGNNNRIPLINGFRLSASLRYDDYSDFGHTYNPKFAVNYEPIEWIDIRGNYGRSFNAPTPVDQLGVLNSSVGFFPAQFWPYPPLGATVPIGSYDAVLVGTAGGLKPQTAHTYSFGFDIRPPLVSGLTVNATYYHIDFDGILANPPIFAPAVFYPYYQKYYTLNPTAAQIVAYASQVPGGLAVAAPYLQPGGPPVYELIDYRKTNLGNAHLSGIDFAARYSHATAFGSIDANVSGNYQLKNETNAAAGLPYASQLENNVSRSNVATNLGATWVNPFGANGGSLRSQVTWNHTAGYSVIETPFVLQNHVGSFEIFNLFFLYNFNGTGLSKDLALSLNLDNVFNRDPPVSKASSALANGAGAGYANGFTLGRLIQLGVDKKF